MEGLFFPEIPGKPEIGHRFLSGPVTHKFVYLNRPFLHQSLQYLERISGYIPQLKVSYGKLTLVLYYFHP